MNLLQGRGEGIEHFEFSFWQRLNKTFLILTLNFGNLPLNFDFYFYILREQRNSTFVN